MKRLHTVGLLLSGIATTCLLLSSIAGAADRVAVIPIGGAVGNATVSDVVKGKTFSSKAAGKGVTGTLDLQVGKVYTNSIGMQFRLIPAGSFVMGSPDGTGDAAHRPVWLAEPGRFADETQHVVTLTEPFYMQTTEVTQGQWEQIMGVGTNPSSFTSCGMDCPVESVSWNDAQNFIDALNASEGRSSCNTLPNNCYSLPTESQWEYAVRGGTLTTFYSGEITNTSCSPLDSNLDKIGWYCGNANSTTHPVGEKEPNNWGLYDMSGNVWEWCLDWYGTYPDGPVTDPTGVASGSYRVFRGGGWNDSARYARATYRNRFTPDSRNFGLGFRLVLPPGQ